MFDFDTPVNRKGMGSDKLLMSPKSLTEIKALSYRGAEMDFKTAPVIVDALKERVERGIFGLTISNDADYINKTKQWMLNVRNWEIKTEWIVTTYGTVNALNIALRAFTSVGDGVIIQPPVFSKFQNLIKSNDRIVRNNALLFNKTKYSMNFEELEQIMSEEETKLFILCNPQNPCACIWKKKDLVEIVRLAKKHNVIVIADEIFAELAFDDNHVYPLASIEGAHENCITCTSLGKSFNFVGTSHANVIIPSEKLRDRFITQRDRDGYAGLCPFMYSALVAAYSSEGKEWIDEMIKYVSRNINFLNDYFMNNLPFLKVAKHEAGCLVWVDCRDMQLNYAELKNFIENKAAIDVTYGEEYGEGGSGFIRVAVGTPYAGLLQSLDRLYLAAKKCNYTK